MEGREGIRSNGQETGIFKSTELNQQYEYQSLCSSFAFALSFTNRERILGCRTDVDLLFLVGRRRAEDDETEAGEMTRRNNRLDPNLCMFNGH